MATLISIISLTGCAGIPREASTSPATLRYTTPVYKDLVSLPPPKGKIIVAVYNFRDQTGQYKPLPNVTSFSTAVTQGATSMMIQALNDSGWFIPVEREGFSNLLNERKIIRAAIGDKEKPSLPPLMYARILLEGGIIAYETNLVTGGFGARYFGLGGSTEYRIDQVTLYLRAVDAETGRILKSVSTTKSILSVGVGFGLYRFVRFKRLLEVETGLTTNEPPQMCVLEAIEKAVLSLIIEGILDNIWALKDPDDIKSPVIQNYLKEKKERMVQFDKEGNLVYVDETEN